MSFQNLSWLYWTLPLLAVLIVARFWRRHYWGHSLVEQLGEEIGGPNPIFRLPRILEACAVGFLLVALLGPVYPFRLDQIERGGLQIMFVLDLSQSMEEQVNQTKAAASAPAPDFNNPILQNEGNMLATPGSKMEAIKKAALRFIESRPGDAIGLVVFSNNAYLVSPATFDHDSLVSYLMMTGTHTLVNEGFTAIGEGLYTASSFFSQSEQKMHRHSKGNVIILLTDGDNNYGRDPLLEVERARAEGTRIYMIGVQLEPGDSAAIAAAVPSTGGNFYDSRNEGDLKRALADINQVEKGVFYTQELRKNEPAYFIFVLLALGCLALRLILEAVPHFTEIT